MKQSESMQDFQNEKTYDEEKKIKSKALYEMNL